MFAGGAAVAAAVAGHSLDVGATNTGNFANSHPRGVPFMIFAPGGYYRTQAPTSVLVVGKNSPIATAKDLNGKTVAVTTVRDLTQAGVMKWSDANGGDSKSIRFIELPASQMDAAIVSGRIDAALLQEPFLVEAKATTRHLAQTYDSVGPIFLFTVYFSTIDWLTKNAATAKKLAAVLKQTAIWANTNEAASDKLLEKTSKIPAATLAQMNRAVHAETIDPAQVQTVIDTMADYKFSPGRFPASEVIWTPPKG